MPAACRHPYWATFEQPCAGALLRGEIRYDADVPVVLSAPSRRNILEGRILQFEVEGFDTLGHPVTLTASGLPPGAGFDDAGDGTGSFDWAPAPGQSNLYWVATHGESMGSATAHRGAAGRRGRTAAAASAP
jgi:hypothetical protein